jgi:hypothetical protein
MKDLVECHTNGKVTKRPGVSKSAKNFTSFGTFDVTTDTWSGVFFIVL